MGPLTQRCAQCEKGFHPRGTVGKHPPENVEMAQGVKTSPHTKGLSRRNLENARRKIKSISPLGRGFK